MALAEQYLCEITGMDAHDPPAGSRRARRADRAAADQKHIIPAKVTHIKPRSWSPTPHTERIRQRAAMAGYTVVSIPSGADGCVDIEELQRRPPAMISQD